MNRSLTIVILAAGQGTRMKSPIPKVLHQLGGIPLLQHVVQTAKQLKPKHLCLIYGHSGEQVKSALQKEDVEWILQEQQNGTGHAVQLTKDFWTPGGYVLVMLGDVPLISVQTLELMLRNAPQHGVILLTQIQQNPTGYGRICRDAKGDVFAIREEKDASESEKAITEVNTGLMVFKTEALQDVIDRIKPNNQQNELYLTDCIGLLQEQVFSIGTVSANNPWETSGVNDMVQLAQLERIWQEWRAEQLMRSGVQVHDPKRLDLMGEITTSFGVKIGPNVWLENVYLGHNVEVGANSVLINCHISENTKILPFSYLVGATVGPENSVGPFSRLRPGTVLGERVHVGNFVEVKNSQIGADSKINHLSYVGDSQVGVRVNIGAGTITCNYDGAKKHTTVIGDDVFVGSGTQLVAPVTLETGATIGAGSTIRKTAPKNRLTLTVSQQKTIECWTRPKKS